MKQREDVAAANIGNSARDLCEQGSAVSRHVSNDMRE
jgi:hypothetical protein